MTRYLGLPFVAALAACGPGQDNIGADALRSVEGLFADQAAGTRNLRASLTPAAINQLGQPVLYTRLASRDSEAGLLVAARNGPVVTWLSQDNISLSLEDGMVISTRGLGDELMSADVEEPLAALRGARETAVRVHRYIDGERQLVPRSFVCTYALAGPEAGRSQAARVVVERCQSVDLAFENRYWLTRDGRIWKSRQWLGPENGHIETELLRPGSG